MDWEKKIIRAGLLFTVELNTEEMSLFLFTILKRIPILIIVDVLLINKAQLDVIKKTAVLHSEMKNTLKVVFSESYQPFFPKRGLN